MIIEISDWLKSELATFFLAKPTLDDGAFDWEIWISDLICNQMQKLETTLTLRNLSISIRNPNSIGKVRNLRKQLKVAFCIVH